VVVRVDDDRRDVERLGQIYKRMGDVGRVQDHRPGAYPRALGEGVRFLCGLLGVAPAALVEPLLGESRYAVVLAEGVPWLKGRGRGPDRDGDDGTSVEEARGGRDGEACRGGAVAGEEDGCVGHAPDRPRSAARLPRTGARPLGLSAR
jgi:hypothetical protein